MKGKTMDGNHQHTGLVASLNHAEYKYAQPQLCILRASLLTVCLLRCRAVEEKLTFEVIYKIFLQGHSRVPVYEVKTLTETRTSERNGY